MSAATLVAALATLLLHNLAHAADEPKGVGFKTVDEALAALKTTPGIKITKSQPDGWIIVEQPEPFTLWSFTPEGHYAHPAVVRRVLKQRGDGIYVEMSALCQNEKTNCDRLIEEFKQLNKRMSESVGNRANK